MEPEGSMPHSQGLSNNSNIALLIQFSKYSERLAHITVCGWVFENSSSTSWNRSVLNKLKNPYITSSNISSPRCDGNRRIDYRMLRRVAAGRRAVAIATKHLNIGDCHQQTSCFIKIHAVNGSILSDELNYISAICFTWKICWYVFDNTENANIYLN